MLMIKAADLFKEQKQKEEKKKEIFKNIYSKIEKKIVLTSKNNFYQCWYEVPAFLVGLPLYKVKDCIEYIITTLKTNGFKVDLYEPNLLYINWEN